MSEYYDTEETTGKPWWSYLLEALVSMFNKLLDLFGNIFDSVLDFLLGLFEGFDPVGAFTGWWNNLKLTFQSIDLTLPQFNVPAIQGIESWGLLIPKTLEILTLNGLGFVIFIPLIIMILRLFL